MLEAAGFDVEVDLGPVTTVLIPRVIIQADYEMAGWGFNADGATWVASLNDNLLSTSGSNRMAFAHPDMDAALGELYGAANVDDQRAALAAVQCVWGRTAARHGLLGDRGGLGALPEHQRRPTGWCHHLPVRQRLYRELSSKGAVLSN